MSEIKVGDKVKVYGSSEYAECRWLNGEKGIVEKIEGYKLKVLVEEYYELEEKNCFQSYYFHRKQCRRLVKMVVCVACCGTGKEQLIEDCPNCYIKFRILEVCTKCNGTGKVKK